MPSPNLQSVLVPKSILKRKSKEAQRKEATELARPYANRIYTSRSTEGYWRFRQRPPTHFKKGSEFWRTYHVPDSGGILQVYGTLTAKARKTKKKAKRKTKKKAKRKTKKKAKKKVSRKQNPKPTFAHMAEWNYLVSTAIPSATTLPGLAAIAVRIPEFEESPTMAGQIALAIRNRANKLGFCGAGRHETPWEPDRCVDYLLRRHPTVRPPMREMERWIPDEASGQQALFKNPSKRIVLKNPRVMPDPGPCAWLGSVLEWKWKKGRDEVLWEPEGEMLFLWSPRLKAVVSVPHPRKMTKKAKVSRAGGGAKLFERFAARSAANTYGIKLSRVPIKKLGTAIHIVYRSDKWNPPDEVDYIHDFKSGVRLYCGPTLEEPEVFLCFGGRLTATERGLVY
jgi:hypothetical protein